MKSRQHPIVLIPACQKTIDGHRSHVVGAKYIDAVHLSGATPWILPSATAVELDTLLDLIDGVLLTGAPSNVHPSHFGEAVRDTSLPLDEERDALTLPLIPELIARGIPLLGICRGFQETNVALGGSLHQAVHEEAPFSDHRANPSAQIEAQYGQAHAVDIVPNGMLSKIIRRERIIVNSLHGQGVNRLAPGLKVEATAPDGLVEAFSIPSASGFALCVEWHPEWRVLENPDSANIFHAFGTAVRRYRMQRSGTLPHDQGATHAG